MRALKAKKSAPKRYGIFVVRERFGKIKGRQRSCWYFETFSSVRAANEELAKPMYPAWKHVKFAVLPLLADEK